MSPTILGTGLSALVWGAYHPGSLLIGPQNLGGSVNSNKGPMMIHATDEVKNLWRMIGLDVETRSVKVGYMRGSTKITDTPGKFFADDYYHHSRQRKDKRPSSVMNAQQVSFRCMDTPTDDIIKALADRIIDNGGAMLDEEVRSIVLYESGRTKIGLSKRDLMCKTSSIVSTLPARVFNRLVGTEVHHLTADDSLTKIFSVGKSYNIDDFRDYDFIYVVPNRNEISVHAKHPTRITILDREKGLVSFEYTISGSEDPSVAKDCARNVNCQDPDVVVLQDLGVRNSKPLFYYKGIRLLGRRAQWDHSIKIDTVVERAAFSSGV